MRPSGSQSIENGSPSTRAMTSRLPSVPKASTSPASQSHIQKRPPCHRGDSPIWIPVAKMSVTRYKTAFDAGSHRSVLMRMVVRQRLERTLVGLRGEVVGERLDALFDGTSRFAQPTV